MKQSLFDAIDEIREEFRKAVNEVNGLKSLVALGKYTKSIGAGEIPADGWLLAYMDCHGCSGGHGCSVNGIRVLNVGGSTVGSNNSTSFVPVKKGDVLSKYGSVTTILITVEPID